MLITLCVGLIEPHGDDLEGVTELPYAPEPPPPPAAKLKVHFQGSRRVFRRPPPTQRQGEHFLRAARFEFRGSIAQQLSQMNHK